MKLYSFLGIILSGLIIVSPVFAAENVQEEQEAEFTLEPMVITAQRYETREVETPASVQILDERKIRSIGANNLQETLKYSLGTNYSTYGPGGNGQSSMTSNINIRGVEKGTLILVNGRPINARGLTMLEKFPVDNIERVEIVRGGGAVLYGSEALGGVINIITKKKADNRLSYDMGNYGQLNTGGHFQEGKLGLTYDYRKWGSVDNVSLNKWKSIVNANPTGRYLGMDYDGSHSNTFMLTYEFSDKLSLLYSFDETQTNWTYNFKQGSYQGRPLAGQTAYTRKYKNLQNILQLNYVDDHFKASVFYNDLGIITRGINYRSTSSGAPNTTSPDASEMNRNFGLDVQYDWEAGKTKYLVGGTGMYEYYKKREPEDLSKHRYNYSLYTSVDHDFTNKTKAILSARYSWQAGNPSTKNLDKFTPQLQLSQKIGSDEYLYASAGVSFKYPTLTETFGSGGRVIGNADVKPQTGKNYEVGWKKNFSNHALRVALFHYTIEDKISAKQLSGQPGTYQYFNEDTKNSGIELEYTYANEKGFNYSLGAAIGNPKTRAEDTHPSRVKKWERAYDKYELNGSIGYQTGNWSFNLHGKYLFGRVHSSSSSDPFGPEKSKPAFYTTLNIRYQVDKRQELYLRVENLFDRDDIVNNSTAEYYYTPVNFVLGYNIKF